MSVHQIGLTAGSKGFDFLLPAVFCLSEVNERAAVS